MLICRPTNRFQARLHPCGARIEVAMSALSVNIVVRTKLRTVKESALNFMSRVSLKFVGTFQFWLLSGNNYDKFTRRHTCVSAH
jgi:hypothetical protein